MAVPKCVMTGLGPVTHDFLCVANPLSRRLYRRRLNRPISV